MGKKEWRWCKMVRKSEGKENGSGAAAGCMSGVLHFFDFHQLLFTTTGTGGRAPVAISSSPRHHHLPPVLPKFLPKGVDAPRNSLEMDEVSAVANEEYFGIPVGIQIAVPSAAVAKMPTLEPLEEERRSTNVATPRTPNLVVRLMGLTMLPDECPSPASTYKSKSVPCSASPTPPMAEKVDVYSRNKKKKKKQNVDENFRSESSTPRRRPLQNRNCNIEMGSRSLPDTPRVSSARPSWDVDRRLSLQINKENSYVGEESQSPLTSFSKPGKKTMPKNQIMEAIKSPRSNCYASEIVKQVKENISNRRTENVVRSVRTRPAAVTTEPWKPPPACAPPTTRFLEPTEKLKWLDNEDKAVKPRLPKPSRAKPTSLSPTSTRSSKFMEKITKQRPLPASSASSSLTTRVAAKVRSKPSLPSFVTVRKELSTTSPTQTEQFDNTIFDEVECALGSVLRQSSRQCRPLVEIDPEFHYVKSVLLHAGILMKPLPCFRWHSPTRPLDPVIFHKLELQFSYNTEFSEEVKWNSLPLGPLKYRWNRKLLFQLVQEILQDISESHHHRGKDCRGRPVRIVIDGESVLQKLWTKIRSFPEADCRVAGDIDALVEGDLQEANIRRLLLHPSVAEEGEELAVVIQNDILDSVLEETAASLARAVPDVHSRDAS